MSTGRRRWRSEAGGAVVEMAVALPVLVLVFAGTVDFGRVFHTSMALTEAARAGAQYGAYSPAQSGNITGMQSVAVAATNLSGVTASASRSCQCATNTGTFSPTVTTASDCTSPQAVSCPGGHLVVTVTVQTSRTFTTVMAGGLPAFMQSMTLTRTATMRAQ